MQIQPFECRLLDSFRKPVLAMMGFRVEFQTQVVMFFNHSEDYITANVQTSHTNSYHRETTSSKQEALVKHECAFVLYCISIDKTVSGKGDSESSFTAVTDVLPP